MKPLQDDAGAVSPKSILKRKKKAGPPSPENNGRRSNSPPARISKAVKDKLAEDDDEIAALEKKLGLKGRKKLPLSFTDDGLNQLLEGLEEEDNDNETQRKINAKAEGDEWLQRKRRAARKVGQREAIIAQGEDEIENDNEVSEESSEEDDDGAWDMSLDGPEFPDDVSEDDSRELEESQEEVDAGNDFSGFESDDDQAEESPHHRVRENPYVAPTVDGNTPSQKYTPPSLRNAASSDSEAVVRVRRQIQGFVNRLTETNLVSILSGIEKLYQDNPRQHVTSTLVDILLISICEPTSLPDTLIILPAGFIAAVYKIVGMDFGAQIIQRTVNMFNDHYTRASTTSLDDPAVASSDGSKETSNLIMLLSELYNFQVVGSNLIFDYVRVFLSKLSELNAELLLKIIRTSGPQLRQDDPSSLKDIVAMLRPAVVSVGEENISVRTKFMIETINDLKNNKMKAGAVGSAITSDHTISMKKILGSLNTRSIKASEPMRIGLKDVMESDKRGKWWLVGASWSGNSAVATDESATGRSNYRTVPPLAEAGTSDLIQLAKEQRMNTDIRRAIFITIMSASDYQDAYLRLMKLKLKKVQEFEIPKVLIHCAASEKSYNPYYTLIAIKVCGDRRLKTSFQFCLWDLFKRMGESEDNDEAREDDEESLDTRNLVNLGKMFGMLIVEGGLSLKVLKNLNLSYLQPKTKMFLEVLFITIFLQSQRQSETKRDKQTVVNIFSKSKDPPLLARGLQYFLKKIVAKTDIAGSKDETATVKWACKVAGNTLNTLVVIETAKA